MLWFGASLVLLALAIGSHFVGESALLDQVFRLAGLGLLIGWYFAQCKPQVQYVKMTCGEAYTRRGWAMPLLAAMGFFAAVLVVVLAVFIVTYEPTPEDVAEIVHPLILAEWEQQPNKPAGIDRITLTADSEDTFVGHIETTFEGRPTRLPLRVYLDGEFIHWQIGAPEE